MIVLSGLRKEDEINAPMTLGVFRQRMRLINVPIALSAFRDKRLWAEDEINVPIALSAYRDNRVFRDFRRRL